MSTALPRLHHLSSSVFVLESPQRYQHRKELLWLIYHWSGSLRHLLSFHIGCARSTKTLLFPMCWSKLITFAQSRSLLLSSHLLLFWVWGLWSKHTVSPKGFLFQLQMCDPIMLHTNVIETSDNRRGSKRCHMWNNSMVVTSWANLQWQWCSFCKQGPCVKAESKLSHLTN